jgi:hypothetical protein
MVSNGISIGTGSMIMRDEESRKQLPVAGALKALTSMISSSEDFIELLMQWVSDSPDPKIIDSEIGDLREDLLAGRSLLSYQRYQTRLTPSYLRSELGLSFSEDQIKILRNMVDPKGLPMAFEVGEAMAERFVREEHFPECFDLTAPDAPALGETPEKTPPMA